MRKSILSVFAALLLAALLSSPAYAAPRAAAAPAPDTDYPRDWDQLTNAYGALLDAAVEAQSAYLIDGSTGKILYKKNEDKRQYPASTTKIMTCLVCLQSLPKGKTPSDITVTVGSLPEEDFVDHSENIELKKGERITLEDLLGMMMVYSGNDAADAVAIYTGGTISKFVKMMNEEAGKLGLDDTHFDNPNGLADDPEHYTTAKDMATLAAEAMKNPLFRKYVSNATYTIGPTNKTPEPRKRTTTNWLFLDTGYGKDCTYNFPYAIGIKTGRTDFAKNSFISAADKHGQYLISAVMGEEVRTDLWNDTITMFEYGFKYYETIDLMDLLKNMDFSMQVKNAAADDPYGGKLSLEVQTPESHLYTGSRDLIDILKGDPSKLDIRQTISAGTAPIGKLTNGAPTVVGKLSVSYQGVKLMVCNLAASRDVAEMPPPTPTPATPTPASATKALPSVSPVSSVSQTQAGQTPGGTQAPLQGSGSFGQALVWVLIGVIVLLAAYAMIRLMAVRRSDRNYRRYDYGAGRKR